MPPPTPAGRIEEFPGEKLRPSSREGNLITRNPGSSKAALYHTKSQQTLPISLRDPRKLSLGPSWISTAVTKKPDISISYSISFASTTRDRFTCGPSNSVDRKAATRRGFGTSETTPGRCSGTSMTNSAWTNATTRSSDTWEERSRSSTASCWNRRGPARCTPASWKRSAGEGGEERTGRRTGPESRAVFRLPARSETTGIRLVVREPVHRRRNFGRSAIPGSMASTRLRQRNRKLVSLPPPAGCDHSDRNVV